LSVVTSWFYGKKRQSGLMLDWRERALSSWEGGLAQELEVISGYDAIPWYVIQTHCRTESRVQMALQRKGLEVFFPQEFVSRMRRGRKVMLHRPLFQSYLFVHTLLDSTVFHQIIRVDGVVRLLGNGAPAPVPAEQIESIRTIVTGDRHYYPWRYLEKGKKVRVIDGPLAGVEGTLIARKDKQRRLVVAVELFQRSVAVELDSEAVERLS
jgi:transcription termination/antitermination protein NusG